MFSILSHFPKLKEADFMAAEIYPRIYPKPIRLAREYRCLGGILRAVKSLIVQAIWSLIRKMSIARSRLAIGSLLDAIRIAGLVPHSQPGSP